MLSAVVALLAAMPVDELRATMLARGVAPAALVIAFAPSPRTEQLAARITGKDAGARAHGLYDAIVALKRSGVIIADRDNSPKARAPKTAADVLAQTDDRRAGCYELSALYVAAGRSLGLDAVGVERADPVGSGQIGHIMAGVRFNAGGPLTVFDLQNETRGSSMRVRELDDLEFAAHHYNHLAVAAFLNSDLVAAQAAIDDALKLAPDAASFLNNRAAVMGAIGEPLIGIADATYAVQLAPDVPLYRYQLGRLLLVSGDLAGARTAFGRALALRPRYGIARRDLGWAMLLLGDAKGAETQIGQALREDPSTPDAGLYLGLVYLADGHRDAAVGAAKQALEKTPGDRSLLALAGLAAERADPGPEALRLREVLHSVERVRGGQR